MKAIDLYAGVGGWAVGFELAGHEIVESYEWWRPAADTHANNSTSPVRICDIRALNLDELPKDIDVVIGSPPCTQFSYSNRGGSGDIADGLVDIVKFLDIVAHVKPKFWAFENVPRVKKVLEAELTPDGQLSEYCHLFEDAKIDVFDMANFGVPQRRKRCIAGNFDFDLLASYAGYSAKPTLGSVITALQAGLDPIYGEASEHRIYDNDPETPLNWEEERFNREMKEAHPIYNGMPFPDPLDRTSRTVTATCTRVSRESLIIFDTRFEKFRRLSVRERASLQSFPVAFQFLGKSHAEKLKMIGNAIPPAFTYLIAEAIKGTRPERLVLPAALAANDHVLGKKKTKTSPDNAGHTYPSDRRFRFCIPYLRFKSGTRFELANTEGPQSWCLSFYFGDSKRIRRKDFELQEVKGAFRQHRIGAEAFWGHLQHEIERCMDEFDLTSMQRAWAHRGEGPHPFELVDRIASVTSSAISSCEIGSIANPDIEKCVFDMIYKSGGERVGRQKISSYAKEIMIGAFVSACVNSVFSNLKALEKVS